jgi:hypothetical protein
LAEDDAVGDGDGSIDAAGDTEDHGNPMPLLNASNASTIGKTNEATSLGLFSMPDLSPHGRSNGPLREQLYQLAVKRRKVRRLAAREKIAVHDNFGIDPFCAGIAQIVLNALVAREFSPLRDSR